MDEVCVWCGEDVGHEPDCPQVAMDAMQQHIEELTEERDSLSSKLEKCEAERAKYERWFYEKFGQAFEAEEDLDALLEANRGLQAKLKLFLEGSREALLKLDRYEQLLATAYQLAGLVGAPVRFLDAYALHDGTDADSLLPVGLDELEEFKALASRLDCARRLAHSWIDMPFTSMDRDTMRTLGNELLRTIGEKWIAESNPGSAVEKPVHPRYTRCPGTIDGEHQWERWENESTGETGMECAVCHDGYPTLSE